MTKTSSSRYEPSDDKKPFKTIEEVRADIGVQFKEFVQTEDYKNLFKQTKADNPRLSDYLILLAIFGWFREDYVNKLPKRFKKEFMDLLKDGNKEPLTCKLKMNDRGGEQLAIRAYDPEEYKRLFGEPKEVKFVNEYGEEIQPFKVGGTEEYKEDFEVEGTTLKAPEGIEQYLK